MIGVIGIGSMGRGIVKTFLRESYRVTVYDIDQKRTKKAVRMGAHAAENITDLVDQCDPIFLSLPNSATLVKVVEESLLPKIKKEQTVIDLGTTISIETRRLHKAFAQKGAYFIDAPVSGGPRGSATGSLYIFVGGDPEPVKVQWPLLGLLGKTRLTYCGSSGKGQITKAVNQMAMGLTEAALIEAIAFGANAGVDPKILLNAIGDKSGFRQEFTNVASRIIAGQGSQMDCKYAELNYFLAESKEKNFPMPILEHLYSWLKKFPENSVDNMGRSFSSFWSSLRNDHKSDN